ncbi:hypothetical protein D3C71_1117640 [compost metagenome]
MDRTVGNKAQVVAVGPGTGDATGGDDATAGAGQSGIAGQLHIAIEHDRAAAGDGIANRDGSGLGEQACHRTAASNRTAEGQVACTQRQRTAVTVHRTGKLHVPGGGGQAARADQAQRAVEGDAAEGVDVAGQLDATTGIDIQALQRRDAAHRTGERGQSPGRHVQAIAAIDRAIEGDRASLQR